MKLIIDAPADQMGKAAILFRQHYHTHGECKIGQRSAKHYGEMVGGIYKATWAIWRTKNGFSMRHFGDDE